MLQRFLLSCVLVIAGFAAGMVMTARMRVGTESWAENLAPPPNEGQTAPRSAAPPASPAAPAPSIAGAGMADFSTIAGRAVKGVVNISSLQVVRMPNSPYASDPFFRYFFRDDDAFGSRDRRSLSLGSGVVISPDGYVITNSHASARTFVRSQSRWRTSARFAAGWLEPIPRPILRC